LSITGVVIFIGIPSIAFAITIGILNVLAEVNFSTHTSFELAGQMVSRPRLIAFWLLKTWDL